MASSRAPLLDDDTLEFGEEESRNEKKLTHPFVTFFHLLFKVSAILFYLLCGVFKASFITSFVTVVLLLSMDFWTVKNITGRLMVGLRWWNYVDDSGKSHWVFEARKNRINTSESQIFWLGLILCPLLWSIFFLTPVFGLSFTWLFLVCIALVLNGANLFGYVKCKMGSSQLRSRSLSDITAEIFHKQVLQNVTSLIQSSQPQTSASAQPNIL